MSRVWEVVAEFLGSFGLSPRDGLSWLSNWLQVLSVLTAVLVVLVVAGRVIPPSWRLLRCTMFQGVPAFWWWAAIRELTRCFVHVLQTHSLTEAVRLRVEQELLHPRPARPPWFASFRKDRRSQRQYRVKMTKWRQEMEKWRLDTRTALADLARESRSGTPTITVDTCFVIHRAEEGIRRYFRALEADPSPHLPHRDRFLSRLRVEAGFVAPLHLVSGLLGHFGDDWEPVLKEYGRTVTRPSDPLDCRHLQTFLFDCWLLWGPSIPLCTCANWQGGVALQYGYGDENNSVPLWSRGQTALATLEDPVVGAPGRMPVALQMQVTGIPRWGSSLHRTDVCTAQQDIRDPEGYGFVLEYESHELIGGLDEDRARCYYSAYLWVIFMLGDAEGRPLSPLRPWTNIFPFFEHGNIAEAKTYAFLKHQLAHKALTGIHRLLDASCAASTSWTLTYACAIDDPSCGAGDAEDSRRFAGRDPAPQLKKIMTDLLDTPEFEALRLSKRLSFSAHTVPEYSSCRLPKIIKQYYATVRAD